MTRRERRRRAGFEAQPTCEADDGRVIFESEEQARYALFEIRLRRALYPEHHVNRHEQSYRPCSHNPMHFHLSSKAPVPAFA